MNQITIVGNVGKQPELKFTQNGHPMCELSICTEYRNKDKVNTVWHAVETWDTVAENVAASVSKGDRVIVIGRISKHDFTTTSGESRTKTYVVATEVAMSVRFAQVEVTRD